jgi:hypothetical protein
MIHADERHALEARAIGRELLAGAAAHVERPDLRGVLAAFDDERRQPPVGWIVAARLVVEMRDRIVIDSNTHYLTEGLRPSDSPTRALARRFAGSLRARGSLAALARAARRRRPSDALTRERTIPW